MLRGRIHGYATVEDLWCGASAPRPSAKVIQKVKDLLNWCEDNSVWVDKVEADVDGGIAVRFLSDPADYFDVTFYNDGSTVTCRDDHGKITADETFDDEQLRNQIRDIVLLQMPATGEGDTP
jgi:hypothetical protein